METTKIVVLGGGFGGMYTALNLEKRFKNSANVEITLVSQENFLLFTPMLHEVAASDLEATAIVSPIHKLLRKVRFFCGSIDSIDLVAKKVVVSHGNAHHSHELPYDHLVLALGSVTHFHNLPGLAENALTMKSVGDAIFLRNRMIAHLEEADFECCKEMRETLLTFVVAGAGFAGVETVAAIHDFLGGVLKFYTNLKLSDIRVVLVHSGKTVLPELHTKLGEYTVSLLKQRGVEVVLGSRVASFSNNKVTLANGTEIHAATLVWTAGTTAHPLIESLSCTKEKGRVLVTETLAAAEYPGVWAVGDCAAIPNKKPGEFHPPTAQHSIREARTVAQNIAATIEGKRTRPFRFKTLGQLASLGHHKGVAQILGFRFSGLIAWILWRGIYLSKLPGADRKLRVALEWALDLVLAKDIVQIRTVQRADLHPSVHAHHTAKENHEKLLAA